MYKIKKECFGTVLEILILDDLKEKDDITTKISDFLDEFENKYSRFKKWNYLYNLNKNKFWICDENLKTMLNLANKINKITNWNFDITLNPLLENAWYGIFEEKLNEKNIWQENIKIFWNLIKLENNINIDLGWIGKWYAIDVIFDIVKKYSNNFIVNFGGDLKIAGKQKFYLEDPLNEWKQIWETMLENYSLASSWQNKRNWHIIFPKTWKSADDKIAVFVKHEFASFADCLATGVFASPIDEIDDILKKISWTEILIIMKNGKIWESENFNSKLYLW